MDDREDITITDGAANVFVDLALPATETDIMKVSIARAITNTIRKRDLTQVEAAKILGTDQAKISALLRGRLKDFSVERLFTYLVLLGRDLEIHISRKYRNESGRIKIRECA